MGTEIIYTFHDRDLDWSAWVTILIITGSALLAFWSLRAHHKSRYGQLIMEVSRRWDDPSVVESAKLLRQQLAKPRHNGVTELVDLLWAPPEVKHRPEPHLDLWLQLIVYPNAIEAIGVLWSEKVLLESVIWKMWGGGIIDAWVQWEEPIYLLRKHRNDANILLMFEKVADRMLELRKHPPEDNWKDWLGLRRL